MTTFWPPACLGTPVLALTGGSLVPVGRRLCVHVETVSENPRSTHRGYRLPESEMALTATQSNLPQHWRPLSTTAPQGHPKLETNSRDRALAAPKAAQFILDNSNLYQIRPDAESESASLALHPLILVYPLGPGAQV